mgnify:CR=1 FL=1
MDREMWREAVRDLPVFDTHTHLNMPGVPIAAQTFWDIAHYFWFQQELWSVGYPLSAAQLSEGERTEAFVAAFNAARNTNWHLIVRHICADLYEEPLVDADGRSTANRVHAVDRAVRARAGDPAWPRAVIDRLRIRNIAVNDLHDAQFPDLPGVGIAVPSWEAQPEWTQRLLTSPRPDRTGSEAIVAADTRVAELAAMGVQGMRVAAEPFEQHGLAAVALSEPLSPSGISRWEAEAFLSHALFRALSRHGMFAQLFLGIERDVSPRTAMAANDPRRITNLYRLFERYDCGFELVIGAPQNNLDAAQAARIYPNVHLGGLWWYNFRQSTYAHAFQVRAEAVPASKSAVVASDARCIEWCYGKVLLVKRLLADFLCRQVEHGWLSRDDALWLAREWLHDAARRRYLTRG